MQHECKITVLETKVFPELQKKYLADPEEEEWLSKQNFKNGLEDAYTG